MNISIIMSSLRDSGLCLSKMLCLCHPFGVQRSTIENFDNCFALRECQVKKNPEILMIREFAIFLLIIFPYKFRPGPFLILNQIFFAFFPNPRFGPEEFDDANANLEVRH